MSYETAHVSAELVNKAFVDKLDGGPDMVKQAMEAGSAYIRQKLYEEGLVRRLFDWRTVTPDELDPDVDSDKPRVLVEKEPDATHATFVGFKGTGERGYFDGIRFPVYFGKIESERLSKSKFELMGIRMPIMDWLKENQVKMVQQSEDEAFMETVKDIVDSNSDDQEKSVSYSEPEDYKEGFIAGVKMLTSLRLPMGKVAMHKNTYLESLNLTDDLIGYKGMDERWERGVDGEDGLWGYPVVTTIKDDIIPENEMYFFAPQEYIAKCYLLQDATLYLKSEADMVQFHTYEAPGMGIGNTKGVVRVKLT